MSVESSLASGVANSVANTWSRMALCEAGVCQWHNQTLWYPQRFQGTYRNGMYPMVSCVHAEPTGILSCRAESVCAPTAAGAASLPTVVSPRRGWHPKPPWSWLPSGSGSVALLSLVPNSRALLGEAGNTWGLPCEKRHCALFAIGFVENRQYRVSMVVRHWCCYGEN